LPSRIGHKTDHKTGRRRDRDKIAKGMTEGIGINQDVGIKPGLMFTGKVTE
jgi:hypothetical protein